MIGPLSGTHSLRGAEADTPFTLASKLKNRKIKFLLIYYQCCGSGPGIQCLFDPWIGEQPKSYFVELRNLFWVKIRKFFDADPGSGMEKIRIRDGKKSVPGCLSRIRNTVNYYYFFRRICKLPKELTVICVYR